MQERIHWIWLSSMEISPRAKSALISHYGNASNVYAASDPELASVKGVGAREAILLKNRDLSEAEHIAEKCDAQAVTVLSIIDSEYPARLREIFAPPVVLYVLGQLPPVDELPVISVIGTRNASPYGVKMGRELAWQIACCGGTVLSLLTAGVDEAAAAGALLCDRPCLAVLGTPIDACRSRYLDQILEKGSVVSEYPPGMQQKKHFFRERNRVAAGLSVGVVVIEAPEKSGTRLFVTEAVEQGKDVFALPGNADAENAAGTIALLKEGATLVTSGKDVMEEYILRFPDVVSLKEPPRDPAPAADTGERETGGRRAKDREKDRKAELYNERLKQLTEDQQSIILAIDASSTHIDDIIERTGLSTAKVLAQLTLLEIKGFVRREIGKRFSLNLENDKKK